MFESAIPTFQADSFNHCTRTPALSALLPTASRTVLLAQRRRRWANSTATSGQRVVFDLMLPMYSDTISLKSPKTHYFHLASLDMLTCP